MSSGRGKRIAIGTAVLGFVVIGLATWLSWPHLRNELVTYRVLAAYRKMHPARRHGPNVRAVHRVTLTLKSGITLLDFLIRINGFVFVQEWCLLSKGPDGKLRLTADITDWSAATVLSERGGDCVEQVREERSLGRKLLMGPCAFRNTVNATPFQLLEKFVAAGMDREQVLRLLGGTERTFMLGPHAEVTLRAKFDGDRSVGCDLEFKLKGGPCRGR